MNRVLTIISWLLVIVGIGYCIASLIDNHKSLPEINFNGFLFVKLSLLVSVIVLTFVVFSEGWKNLVLAIGFPLTCCQSFAIMGRSQIGKYLPGNVFHYAGRASIGIRHGISYPILAATVWAETLLVLVSAGIIISVGVLIDASARNWLVKTVQTESLLALFLLICVLLVPFVILLLFRKRISFIDGFKNLLRPVLLGKVVLLYLLFFVLHGCIVKLIPNALWGNGSSFTLVQAIWRFSLCWFAGFIVPGAPAGLGVREAMFTRLFSTELGEGGASCLAIVFRVITTVSDLLIFSIAWWVGRRVLHCREKMMPEMQ